MQAIARLVRSKADSWLFQLRAREPGEVFLNRRRVFIVPTRAGLGFALLLLLLLIGSINYSLGLGFGLTFTIGACALVDMVLTFRNLAYLHLAPGCAAPVFAGEQARFELLLHNRTRLDRYALWVDFLIAGEPRHVADVGAGAAATVTASVAAPARGTMAAPRVRLQTRFPLGLFRAWSYWQPDLAVLVYPAPESSALAPPLPVSEAGGADAAGPAGHDDFAGIRSYQPGDSLRHLAWRQIARLDPAYGGALVTKHFEGGALAELVLDFAALPATLDLELRLARLTRWVLEAEARALPYALRIGAQQFAPSCGSAHRAACLRALALYGLEGQ